MRHVAAVLLVLAAGLALTSRAEAARVLVFNSTRFVDANQGSAYPEGSQESENVQAALAALGHTVTPIAGPEDPVGTCGTGADGKPVSQPGTVLATGAEYAAALAAADVFLIPEQESWCYLAGELWEEQNQPIVTAWHDWVVSGGGLVIHSSKDARGKVSDLLFRLFGFELPAVDGVNDCQPPTSGNLCTPEPDPSHWSLVRRPAASGTAFEAAPARLRVQESTGLAALAGLPAGARSLYDDGTHAGVVLIPVGAGKVIVLGWDWTDSDPPFSGGLGGGWLDVLRAAVLEAAARGSSGGGGGGGSGGGGGAPAFAPGLTLALSASTVHPGDLLVASLTAANPGGPGAVDVYFGMLLPPAAGGPAGCPAGEALEVIGAGFARTLACLATAPSNVAPLVRNVPVGASMPPVTLAGFFAMTWPADRSAGPYTFFMVLTRPGAFDDGRIDAGDIVTIATATAVASP